METLTDEEIITEVLANTQKYPETTVQVVERMESMLNDTFTIQEELSVGIENMFSSIVSCNDSEYIEYDENTIERCQAFMRGVVDNVFDKEK